MHLQATTRREFVKGAIAGGAICLMSETMPSAAALPMTRLPRALPNEVGVSPDGVLAFVDAIEQKVGGLHSFMLLRHGKVAAEGWWAPYGPQYPHMLYSLSKSFTSTAVGLAVTDGLFSIDAPVLSFFPDDRPPQVSDNLAAVRVRHLLTMSTGHDKDATVPTRQAPDGNWVRAFLALPVEHAPGSKFVYNSAATYMLSAIVQKLTGKKVLDFLTPRLFQPLGIVGPTWEVCPRGINTGGWGLSIKTEDIARFGQLYLHKGNWEGRQLVPERWVAEATSKQISNGTDPNSDWAQGYCYQFWRCRHGAFRGDGAFGQYCVVMPELDAVLAITSGLGDMQAVLNVAWDHLLPAMASASPTGETGALKKRLSGLAISAPDGKPGAAIEKTVSGARYRLHAPGQPERTIALFFEPGVTRIVETMETGDHTTYCGKSKWEKTMLTLADDRSIRKAAVRGAWADDRTYTVKTVFYETPFIQTQTYAFDGGRLTVSSSMNVSFGPTKGPTLAGRRLA